MSYRFPQLQMNPNKIHNDANSVSAQSEPFYFQFTHPTARTVSIAGSFNDWKPETKPLHSMGDSYWVGEMVLLPGTYEYCLVVDGQWIPDPLAKETVANPYGGRNSVLSVVGPYYSPAGGTVNEKQFVRPSS
jgi:1,4-alpha-glucan branching enzyme